MFRNHSLYICLRGVRRGLEDFGVHMVFWGNGREINRQHTAISIYVVGSKLQGYGTRPKGGMGRLELILGFRGCRREMDMEAENTSEIFAVWTRHC